MSIGAILERFIVDELLVAQREVKITPETSLLSTGIIDSLSLIRLIRYIEERFGVVVEDEEVVPENFGTIKSMEALVAGKKGGPA